jgi:hypothetical protein
MECGYLYPVLTRTAEGAEGSPGPLSRDGRIRTGDLRVPNAAL